MIPVCEPSIGNEELQNVQKAVKSGFISGTAGKYIEEFERKFARYCNCEHGIATSSGTTALHLAVESVGLGPGDEVIVPDITNAATAFSVVYANAEPVFVDCDPDTWCLNPRAVNEEITERTKAIMPVHLYGHPVDMDPILDLAEDHDLTVIEDGAEAHGASYKGDRVGGLGDVGCFSFYANKIITTGEGGILVTDNEEIAERARLLRNLAFDPDRRFRHNYVGYNYRMTNVQASIGVAQFNKIERFIEKKRKIAHQYNNQFDNSEYISTPVERSWAKNVYWMYSIVLSDEAPLSRDEFREELRTNGIDTRSFFLPLSNQDAFAGIGQSNDVRNPIAKRLAENGLYLPSGVTLTEKEVNDVANTINRILNK